MNKILKFSFILKFLIISKIALFYIFIGSAHCKENFIVTIVNKIPITNNDVLNRAKLISFSIKRENNFKNLSNYYNQSLKSLINEKIILSAGFKINKNIIKMITPKANQLLLSEFNNSKIKLDEFLNLISIPKSTLLEKYQSQLVWGIVLKNKFKVQLTNLEKKIEYTINSEKNRAAQDLYDLAEIVINKKNNYKLLSNIKNALANGVNFLHLAKQVSISNSSKFGGKVGWKNYQNLPKYIKSKKIILNEGDIISFPINDKIKIVKILAKRLNGKASKREDNISIAQIKFPINFQNKNDAYLKVKTRLGDLLLNQKNCNNLKLFRDSKSSNYSFDIIKSRIADLSSKIQNVIQDNKLFEISQPLFIGNHGYTYVLCEVRKKQLKNDSIQELKNKIMKKNYLIFSERLLKRLYSEADISNLKDLK